MQIHAIVWLPEIVEKLDVKHSVAVEEVEEVFELGAHFRRGPVGNQLGEDLYKAYGQTSSGRYLFIVFIFKRNRKALILNAREMSESERRLYRKVSR